MKTQRDKKTQSQNSGKALNNSSKFVFAAVVILLILGYGFFKGYNISAFGAKVEKPVSSETKNVGIQNSPNFQNVGGNVTVNYFRDTANKMVAQPPTNGTHTKKQPTSQPVTTGATTISVSSNNQTGGQTAGQINNVTYEK